MKTRVRFLACFPWASAFGLVWLKTPHNPVSGVAIVLKLGGYSIKCFFLVFIGLYHVGPLDFGLDEGSAGWWEEKFKFPCLLFWWKLPLKIPRPVDLNSHVQERQKTFFRWKLHFEIYCWMFAVQVLQRVLSFLLIFHNRTNTIDVADVDKWTKFHEHKHSLKLVHRWPVSH